MEFKYAIPTKIYFGENCIAKNAGIFAQLGKTVMIVTGKHSAKASGALNDVVMVMDKNKIECIIFDEIENNPSVETVEKAGKIAVQKKVDFIIGIGGGSPIDASKAIAVLAANPDIIATDLFKNDFEKVLPIIAIPTTAGTGSEVTSYSVLVRKDLQTKVSFGTEKTYPQYAFLDAKYTFTLGKSITINTAVDAFTHALEGYLANRSTVISECLSLEAIKTFGKSMRKLANFELDNNDRENLMYASLLGGIIIAQTGVTIAHGMGYCYTFFKDIPHGKANGFIMREYLKLNYDVAKAKIDNVLNALDCSDIDEFADILKAILGDAPKLTVEEIQLYTELTQIQKGSMSNTPHEVNAEVIYELWSKI